MTVMVTGGAGFIGSTLCRQLVAEHDVVVVDDFSRAREGTLPDAVEVVRLDLATAPAEEIRALVLDVAPDLAVHLAAIHYIPYCIEHPELTFATNVRSTDAVCRALAETSCRRVVFTSTADVYAVTDEVHHEDDRPEPRNIYGLSKLLSEHIVEYTAAVAPTLSGTCVRLANVYGPGETNPHVIPDALAQVADRSSDVLRMGALVNERDFVHVTDVARAIRRCLATDTGEFSTFNVGTGISTPVSAVVAKLQELSGDGRAVVQEPARLRRFDRKTLNVDTTRLRQATGWAPEVTLDAGLADLVEAARASG